MRKIPLFAAGALFASFASPQPAQAADRIVRLYQSPRTAGMGGVRITTGFYEENFFGNPARTADNPAWRLFLVDASAETNLPTIGKIGDVVAGADLIQSISDTAGESLHARGQTFLPGFYVPHVRDTKLSLAVALFLSSQLDMNLRKSYHLTPGLITDVGPVLSGAYSFLKDDALSVGLTVSALYRFSAEKNLSLVELLQGQSFGPTLDGAEGAHIELGLGGQYRLPKFLEHWDFDVALSLQNLFAGTYHQIAFRPLTRAGPPRQQPRTLGIGVAARTPELWKFTQGVIALEFLEIGNSGGGAVFRHIHLGTEWRYRFLLLRLGLNQGYFGGGLGLDLTTWTADIATYGEEIGLNAGDLQDRRIAFRIGLQI